MSLNKSNPRQLGKRIKRLRQEKGLSQWDVAEPLFTAAYISHLEHGKRRPSPAALAHIAERLEISPEQLLSGRDPHGDLRLEIEIQSAVAELHAGDAAAALERLEVAKVEAEEWSNDRALLRAEVGVGQALHRLGETDRALGVFQRAEERAQGASPEERTGAKVGRARCLFQLGKVHEALHLLESHRAQLQASEPPDPTFLLQTYAALIPPYFAAGLLDKAREVAKLGWEMAPDVPDLEQRACLYVNRAGLLLTQGEPRDALASLALAEDLFRQLGWRAEEGKVVLARSHTLIEQDELAAADGLLRGVLESPRSAITKIERGQALVHLAQVRRRLGDAREGLGIAREAASLAGTKLTSIAAEAYREEGLCHLDLREPQRALTAWRKALKLFRQINNHEDIAKTALLIGDQLMKSGDAKKSASAYRDGLESLGQIR